MSGVNVGSAYLTIIPSARGFTSALGSELGAPLSKAGEEAGQKVTDGMDKSSAGIGTTLAKWGQWAGVAAIGAGTMMAASVIKTGIAYNAMSQQAQAAFTTILGSGAAAEKMMADIAEFGKTSPFPRDAFIKGTQQMLSFGIEANKVIPILGSIQDAVAAFGGGAQEIEQIVLVFSQIQAQGKITGNDLMQLANVGIDAASILGEHLGKSGAQIRDDISSGAIDAETAIDGLTKGLDSKFGGAAANVKETWAGAVDRVKASLRDLGSAIVEPFISASKGGAAIGWANSIADGFRLLEGMAPGIVDVLRTGQFNAEAWAKTDIGSGSPLITGLQAVRTAAISVAEYFGNLGTKLASLFTTASSSGAFTQLGTTMASIGTSVGTVVIPALVSLAETLTNSFADVGSILGISTWTLFITTLQIAATLMETVIAPALQGIASFLADNQGLVTTLVAAWTAYKLVVAAVAFGQFIAGVAASIGALGTQAAALYGNIAAWVALRVEVVASVARQIAAWTAMGAAATAGAARTTAAWIATKAQAAGAVAVQVAQLAILGARWAWVGIQAMINGARMAAAWVLSMGPVGWIIAAVIAAVALIIYYWDEIVAGLEIAWNWVKDIAIAVWNGIKAYFQFWLNAVVALFTAIWNGIVAYYSFIFNTILKAVKLWIAGFKAIINWFASLPGLIGGWFAGVYNAAVGKLTDLLNWVKTVPGKIKSALGNLKNLLVSAGKNVISGLLNGLQSAAGGIWSWLQGLLGGMKDKVLSFFGIKSPSRLFMYYGEMIGAGFTVGLEGAVPRVMHSTDMLIDAADPVINPTANFKPVSSAPGGMTRQDAAMLASAFNDAPIITTVEVDSQEIARANDRGNRKLGRRK